MSNEPFWKTKKLAEMTHDEWESLCDGCGQCCLHKYEDEDTGEIYHTRVACRLLDIKTARCKNYHRRKHIVSECLVLSPDMVGRLKWLPETCAYRLLAEGKDLPDWHPLVTGDPESVHRAGISVRGWAISEKDADLEHWEDYVLNPPDEK